MLVFLAIGDEVAHSHQEWFLNTPVLWLGALVLISPCAGATAKCASASQKAFEVCGGEPTLALGLLILLMWEPVPQAAKRICSSNRNLDSAFWD